MRLGKITTASHGHRYAWSDSGRICMEVVPFGKYKNQPVEVLAQDKPYCEWLVGQGWVAERFPGIHTIIINNFGEPTETPEHNALQLRFLDHIFRLQVSVLRLLACRSYITNFAKGRGSAFLQDCGAPIFERAGIDVQWRIEAWIPIRWQHQLRPHESPYGWCSDTFSIAVECKPSLGDDYPAVLRQLHSQRHAAEVHAQHATVLQVVVVNAFSFRGGTISQVQALFQASGVLLLDVEGIESLPIITPISREELPNAAEYFEHGGTHELR